MILFRVFNSVCTCLLFPCSLIVYVCVCCFFLVLEENRCGYCPVGGVHSQVWDLEVQWKPLKRTCLKQESVLTYFKGGLIHFSEKCPE